MLSFFFLFIFSNILRWTNKTHWQHSNNLEHTGARPGWALGDRVKQQAHSPVPLTRVGLSSSGALIRIYMIGGWDMFLSKCKRPPELCLHSCSCTFADAILFYQVTQRRVQCLLLGFNPQRQDSSGKTKPETEVILCRVHDSTDNLKGVKKGGK